MKNAIFSILILLAFGCSETSKSIVPLDKKNPPKENFKEEKVKKKEENKFEEFLEAVISENKVYLRNSINFPILVRGSLDSDPEVFVSKEKFYNEFLPLLLNEEVICGKEIVKNIDRFKLKHCLKEKKIGKNHIQVGNFLFKKNKGEWKLDLIFSNVYATN